MTHDSVAALEAKLREGYRKKYKPNARQEALYDFIASKPYTKESPATQEEIIEGVRFKTPDGYKRYYEPYKSQFNNDLCRTIYSDIDALNFCESKDRIIGKTNDYRYYVVQDEKEKDEIQQEYLSKSIVARIRYEAIQRKAELAGQGKLLSSTLDAHPLTKECKPFREPLPSDKRDDGELCQGSLFDVTWKEGA